MKHAGKGMGGDYPRVSYVFISTAYPLLWRSPPGGSVVIDGAVSGGAGSEGAGAMACRDAAFVANPPSFDRLTSC